MDTRDKDPPDELARLKYQLDRIPKGREPAKIGDVVNRLIAQRGYLQMLSNEQLQEAWKEAAGPQLAAETLPGNVRRGVLDIFTTNSCLIQELTFHKAQILDRLRKLAPEVKIRDLRFRIGNAQ